MKDRYAGISFWNIGVEATLRAWCHVLELSRSEQRMNPVVRCTCRAVSARLFLVLVSILYISAL